MRTVLLMCFIVLVSVGVASAQIPGSVGVFSEATGASCELADVAGVANVYVLHKWTDGATASEFQVNLPACMVWLADNSPFTLKSGNFKDGTSIPYQTCLDTQGGPISLGFMIFSLTGACPPCTYMTVAENPFSLPAPLPGEVYVVDCTPGDPQLLKATGGEMIINPVTGTCECDVPVEDTTWGQVKALFE